MRKKLLLVLLCLLFVCSLGVGTVMLASADETSSVENTSGCTITVSRDSGEKEYRINLNGTGVADGSLNRDLIKINDKTLAEWVSEGEITEVFDTGLAGPDLIRIDLPDYADGILKLDGTDTVTLCEGFVLPGGTAQAADYVQTLTTMVKPTIDFGFPAEIVVEDNAFEVSSANLTFTPTFTAGSGTEVRNSSVELNDVALTPASDGSYTARFSYGDNTLTFYTENVEAPNVLNEQTITVSYPDPVVEGPVYVSAATFRRNVEGRPNFRDALAVRFSNVIEEADRAGLTLEINGTAVTSETENASLFWSADGRQVTVNTLFFNSNNPPTLGGFYNYDGTDTVVVGGVTEAENTLGITSDGQVYNVTRGEEAPAYDGTGYVTINRVEVQRNHEIEYGYHKDAIHIYFNEGADIQGSAALTEGVLLFNTNTILVNGKNLQAFWDANNQTTAYWVNHATNSYVRVDIFYDGVSEELWDRDGMNTITLDPSFITMTNLGLGQGAGDYTYDALDGTVYAPGESIPTEVTPLTLDRMSIARDQDGGANDYILFYFNEEVWTEDVETRREGVSNIRENLLFNGKTLAELLNSEGTTGDQFQIYLGADGANVARVSISAANDHAYLNALLNMDGADTVVIQEGFGLSRWVCVTEEQSVKGLDDVTNPTLTVTGADETDVTEAQYAITVSAEDASGCSVVVRLNGTIVEGTDGTYAFTLAAGKNTITITATDNSVFANTATQTVTVTYTEPPVITVNGLTDGAVLNAAAQTITVAVTPGSVTSVLLGETELTVGTNGRYALTLAEGENVITVTAANGTATSSLTLRVTLDTTAPVIATSAKEETVTAAAYTFTVSADGATTLVVRANGETLTAENGSYTVTLKEGENTISVTATDAAGNIATQSVKVTYRAPEGTGGQTGGDETGGGCGSSVGASALVLGALALAGAAVVIAKKRSA